MARNHRSIRGLFSPSFKQFLLEARRTEDYSFWDTLHGLIYARWVYLYIGMGKGDHPLARKIKPLIDLWLKVFPAKGVEEPQIHDVDVASHTHADGYHGKVTTLESARQLITINEPINLPDLEQVVPYVRARAIIQENPDHIAVLDCPCRFHVDDPCLPMDVCIVVGEPFASFIVDHNSEHARWITPEEAVGILEAEDARGHVHHAFFKDAMLGRFYAICNCCSCCCGAIGSHKNGTPMLASSGYVAYIDEYECISCDTCSEYCQFDALGLKDGMGFVANELCMGCGVCVSKCPQNAIRLLRDESKGTPLEILALMQEAASKEK
jgi:Pyruvate/2-oxoacid:ferredoxin oxidoreductase delta subunit